MEKKFDKFLKAFENKRLEGSKKFKANVKNKVRRISELFDTEELKGAHELPWMQGEFGQEGKLGKELVKSASLTHGSPIEKFNSRLIVSFPYLLNFMETRTSQPDTNPFRIVYDIEIDKGIEGETLRSRSSLNISINDLGGNETYTYYFDFNVTGMDSSNNEYDMVRGSYAQGIVDFDKLIISLNKNVMPKLKEWGSITKKWFGYDPISDKSAVNTRVKPMMN